MFLLWGFPVGLPQLFVRTVVAGEGFVGLARLNFLFRVGFAQLLCRIFASGLSHLLGFRSFFALAAWGGFFFELEPFLIVLFHVGLDFLFCFTSDLRGFLLEWCFRSFALSFHFIYLASARRRRR